MRRCLHHPTTSFVQRALHWVFKIGSLKDSLDFFSSSLSMHVHRHEEFASGCVSLPWLHISSRSRHTFLTLGTHASSACRKPHATVRAAHSGILGLAYCARLVTALLLAVCRTVWRCLVEDRK